jgi:hypothetical protein
MSLVYPPLWQGFQSIPAKELARLKVTHPTWRFERDGGRVVATRGRIALVSKSAGTLEYAIMIAEKDADREEPARRA